MKTERITDLNHPDWAAIWKIYEASFPAGERRTLEGQNAIIAEPRYSLELWRNDDGAFVGFTAMWVFERFRFLEHFAVDPGQRSGGYGKRILTELMHRPGPTILLEIDPPTDEISRRRHGFYHRLGFLDNPFEHSHPSYQDGTGVVPLVLMSYPEPISDVLYQEFARCEIEEMLAHLKIG